MEKRREGQGKIKGEEEKANMRRREGQGKRKGEEEKTNGRRRVRERVRRRRESSSCYKWQSLPGAYDKGLSELPDIEIPQ